MYKRSAEPVSTTAPGRAAQTCLIRVATGVYGMQTGTDHPDRHSSTGIGHSQSGETDLVWLKKKSKAVVNGGGHQAATSFSPPNPRACRVGVRGGGGGGGGFFGGAIVVQCTPTPDLFPQCCSFRTLILWRMPVTALRASRLTRTLAVLSPIIWFCRRLTIPFFLKTCTHVVAWVYVLHATRDSNEAERVTCTTA